MQASEIVAVIKAESLLLTYPCNFHILTAIEVGNGNHSAELTKTVTCFNPHFKVH